MRIPRARVLLLIGFFTLGSLAYISYHMTRVWSCGRLPDARFAIRFVDAADRPLEGVRLRVCHASGGPIYGYPVTDFTPNHTPTSDRTGLLVFHHFGNRGIEFCGSTRSLFWCIPIDDDGAPEYLLKFLKHDHVIHETSLRDLRKDLNESNAIAVDFPLEAWRDWNTAPTADVGEWYYHSLRNDFDVDKDGRFDRSELVALQNTVDHFDDIQRNDAGTQPLQAVMLRIFETAVRIPSLAGRSP